MIKILPSADGKFYYSVVATNGKVFVSSETFATRRNARRSAEGFLELAKHLAKMPEPIRDFTA